MLLTSAESGQSLLTSDFFTVPLLRGKQSYWSYWSAIWLKIYLQEKHVSVRKKVLYMHYYVYSIIYKCFSKWITCFGLCLNRSFYINANYLFLVVIFVFQASLFSLCFLALNTQQIPLHLYFIQSLFHLCPQSPCSI